MYNRDSEQMKWARDQMERAGLPDNEREVMEEMLVDFWPLAVGHAFTEKDSREFLFRFSELAQGHVLVSDDHDEDAVYEQARPGQLVIRDQIRVKTDAYSGAAGLAHNGRLGVIVALRYGDIHVRYTDDRGSENGFSRHSPFVLEKRVR